MMSFITYNLIIFKLDGVMLFLQLKDIQNVHKIHFSVQTRLTGNSNTPSKNLSYFQFFYALESKQIHGCIKLLLNISLSVKSAVGGFTLVIYPLLMTDLQPVIY